MSRQHPGFHLILHVARLVEDRLRERLLPLGIHSGQARVIDALALIGECSQVKLARELNITSASMSTMTSRLIANEYVQKRSDPADSRNQLLSLTNRGQVLMKSITEAWWDVDQIIRDKMGETKSAQLFELGFELRNSLGGLSPMGRKK